MRALQAALPIAWLLLPLSAAAAPPDPSSHVGSIGVPSNVKTSSRAMPKFDRCAQSKGPFIQSIAVEEDLGIPRDPPIVGFPIPFSKDSGTRSLNGFWAATPDATPLPTQVEVLSRWGDGPSECKAPIRWAYVWALAEVPKQKRAYLSIRNGQGPKRQLSPSLKLTESSDRIVIDSGAARFTIDKRNFNGLSKVELAGAHGYAVVMEADQSGSQGLLVEKDGRLASPLFAGREEPSGGAGGSAGATSGGSGTPSGAGTPPSEARRESRGPAVEFEIERAGPILATVAVKGRYAFQNGEKSFLFTTRFHFYAGSTVVQLDHTFTNGEVEGSGSAQAKNRMHSDRVFLRMPLKLGGASALSITARLDKQLHALHGNEPVTVQQMKRSPDQPEVLAQVTSGTRELERAPYADAPLLAVGSASGTVLATIPLMGPRDPQALRWNATAQALEIDWQSEPMWIGGARGIWSKAVLDFSPKSDLDLAARGNQLYAHGARPLIGVPSTGYINLTKVRPPLPARALPKELAPFDEMIDAMHDRTSAYLRRYRITGLQIWPDLKRESCDDNGSCEQLMHSYFQGGDNNYWDWSQIEIEQFLRTADPAFLHDFALGEATTMAETISFRPDPAHAGSTIFAGLSPCYGGGSLNGDPWQEGNNQRRDSCAEYSYNAVQKLVYVLTADHRFTDFFDQGAQSAINWFLDPPSTTPHEWHELGSGRLVFQIIEQLLNGAEFGRIGGLAQNRKYRDAAIRYFKFLADNAMSRGHACELEGTKFSEPRKKGDCNTTQAWMIPPFLSWVERLGGLYDLKDAQRWPVAWGKMSTKHNLTIDGRGLPDFDSRNANDPDDQKNGWRTVYRCLADASGIKDETCRKSTTMENESRFYVTSLSAYLNNWGLVLAADPSDPLKICQWLPEAYAKALAMTEPPAKTVYNKSSGLSFAYTQITLGALESCKR